MDPLEAKASRHRLRNPPFLILLLCVLALIIAISLLIWTTGGDPTYDQSNEAVFSRDKTALLISTNHYKKPDYHEVYRHTGSIQQLNTYLQTLDPYSKYLSSREAAFIERRNRKNR